MKHIFFVLQCIGLWRPVQWQSNWKTKLYHVYTAFVMFIMTTSTFSQFMALTMSMNDVAEFASNSFMLLTLILDDWKAVNILVKRGEIIELTKVLQQDPCQPKCETEYAIQRQFDGMVRSIFFRYGTLVASVVTVVTLRSFMEDIPQRHLPYKAWFPFNCHESLLGYSVAYTSQTITVGIGGLIGIAFDSFLPALMLQTCAQLNILKQRFHEIPQSLCDNTGVCEKKHELDLSISNAESILLSKCVRHHIEIFKFAKSSNDIFSIMIFLQCVVSTAVLCLCLFRLSKLEISSTEFPSLFSYMVLMSVQIFLYCFYGCQVTSESLTVGDAIFEMDWFLLSVSTQRSLLTIMAQALIPIEFISGHIVILNLESFNSVSDNGTLCNKD